MTRYDAKTEHHRGTLRALGGFLLLLLLTAAVGCGVEFDDEHQYLLKKAELLSITLDPPAVGPAETSRASLLLADAEGEKAPGFVAWFAGDPMSLMAGESSEALVSLKLGTSVEFEAPAEKDCVFDDEGNATLPLGLLVQIGELPADVKTPEEIMEALPRLLDDGVVKLASRTLQIRKGGAPQAVNPRVAGISVELEDEAQGAARPQVALVHHDDADIAAARHEAKAKAISVIAEERVHLHVAAAPPSDLDKLRLQWVATGGDLKGRRLARQPWVAPKYKEPKAGEPDPNVYTLWLIARDDPETEKLGQSWFEFYLRVTPKP